MLAGSASAALGHLAQHRLGVAVVIAAGPDRLPGLVLGQLLRAEVAQVLVDPVADQAAADPVRPPAARCISPRQAAEVFQSSIISWSSKIIDDGTVDSSHRTCGSLQDSA